MHPLRVFLTTVMIGWCTTSAGAIVINIDEPDGLNAKITGSISRADVVRLKSLVNLKTNPWVVLSLDSTGGDWYAAMELGYFLRQSNTIAMVGKEGCFSACVLLLAGATRRWIEGPVGIHRPYSTDIGALTYNKAQSKFRSLENATRQFLNDMNLPDSLFDTMIRVPPESVHVLSKQELEQFGLSQPDVVTQELEDSEQARKYGLTKQEYLSRKAGSRRICASLDRDPVPNAEGAQKWVGCVEAVLRGLR